MNAAFRSHLMQQFVAAARNQARTPIALMGWIQQHPEESDEPQQSSGSSCCSLSSTRRRQQLSSIATLSSHASPPDRMYSDNQTMGPSVAPNKRAMSALSAPPHDEHSDPTSDNTVSEPARETLAEKQTSTDTDDTLSHASTCEKDRLTASFQTLLRTRRTTSKFRTTLEHNDGRPATTVQWLTPDQYRSALDRAVVAGRAAPNHKRTEPFSFRRLLAPSESVERLADIAAQVYLRQKTTMTTTTSSPQSSNTNNNNSPDPAIVAAAQRKRDKWSQIPAFLVTLVSTRQSRAHPFPNSSSDDSSNSAMDHYHQHAYDPLPYNPPASERALEDYAAACAATQNVLLSLHSEGLASKWATGPVVQTPAFRELVHAEPGDRVVALIMIGQHHHQQQQATAIATGESSSPPPRNTQRRFRRSLEGDVLRDL